VAGAEAVLERLTALRERAPDDLELQLDAARAGMLLAEALEGSDADQARVRAGEAAVLAREVVNRRPDRAEAALLLVRATLLSGHPGEALEAARLFSARGMKEVAPLLAEAALFAGDFEAARAEPLGQTGAPEASLVLVRALADAWMDRPSDAVIQARALQTTIGTVGWAPSRLSRALEGLPSGTGRGEGAVRRFAAQWREQGPEVALAGLVTTLEGQLSH
jgi:hypothetical protein